MRPDEHRPLVQTWDETRIAHLVVHHQRGVAAYLLSIGCQADAVDDLVQETFLALLRSPFEERSPAATATFLRSIARNLFCKSLRRGRREFADLDAIDAAWVHFVGDDDGDSYLAALQQCLAELTATSREALSLRYRDGLAPSAIAARLQLSIGGTKSTLLRAKERLRACIRRKVQP